MNLLNGSANNGQGLFDQLTVTFHFFVVRGGGQFLTSEDPFIKMPICQFCQFFLYLDSI